MHNDSQSPNSAAEFLKALGVKLKAEKEVDTGLADVLCTTLITATPSEDAVDQALTAIEKLAEERASKKLGAKDESEASDV